MKISIIGHGTLAAATAECCARHFTVSLDPTPDADVLWICYDTPINADGSANTDWILAQAGAAILGVTPSTAVVLSSQVPVGTTARLEKWFPEYVIAHSPENIRVASAVSDFEKQSRIVVGTRDDRRKDILTRLLEPFTDHIIWTTPETAELAKHALNCFLGLQIAFINEIARVGKAYGVDMETITTCLRTDQRVSMKAPLRAGPAFDGGHLARDIIVLGQLAKDHGISLPIISHILESNGQT